MAMASLTNINFHHRRDSASSLMIKIRLFYTTVIIFHAEMCNAQATALCNPYQYRDRSKFESNLKTVFKILVQHTSQTGFNTSVYGQGPDQISGLLQCRGDTTVDECYNCALLATTNIKQFCRNGIGARVWFDFCYLRYENHSFIGHMEEAGGISKDVKADVTNPSVSIAVLEKLLSNLSAKAASATKRCAFGTTVDSWPRKIYGQAECTRDISTDDCTTCLSNTISESLVNHSGNQGLQSLKSSCIVRYDRNSFFNLTELPPAEAPAHTPPKHITPSSPHVDHSKKIPIILSVVGAFLLVLFVCLFAMWRRLKSDRQGNLEKMMFCVSSLN